MRAALTFLRAHTLAGAAGGAVVGLLDGVQVLMVSAAPGSVGAVLAPAGLGVVLGLLVGVALGGVGLLLRLDPEVDGDEVVERWPARLIASGVVAALLAGPLYLAMSIPVMRFANDFYRVAGAVLVALAVFALLTPATAALSSVVFRRLRRWMPRRGNAVVAGTNGRWAAGLLALVLVPAGVAWFATDIEVALGAAPFVGLCALVAAQWVGVAGVGRLERSALLSAHPGRLWLAVPALALVGALSFAGTVGAEPGRTALLGASLLVPRPLQLVWRAADRDGDGYAALLGGGDCDDGDPATSPVAIDLPGNGLDEDCSGADAHALDGSWAPAPIRPTPGRPQPPPQPRPDHHRGAALRGGRARPRHQHPRARGAGLHLDLLRPRLRPWPGHPPHPVLPHDRPVSSPTRLEARCAPFEGAVPRPDTRRAAAPAAHLDLRIYNPGDASLRTSHRQRFRDVGDGARARGIERAPARQGPQRVGAPAPGPALVPVDPPHRAALAAPERVDREPGVGLSRGRVGGGPAGGEADEGAAGAGGL